MWCLLSALPAASASSVAHGASAAEKEPAPLPPPPAARTKRILASAPWTESAGEQLHSNLSHAPLLHKPSSHMQLFTPRQTFKAPLGDFDHKINSKSKLEGGGKGEYPSAQLSFKVNKHHVCVECAMKKKDKKNVEFAVFPGCLMLCSRPGKTPQRWTDRIFHWDKP